MEAAETFEQAVDRLARELAPVPRGVVERILIEEHELLLGLQPGDIVPPVVVDATIERIERRRETGAALGEAEFA